MDEVDLPLSLEGVQVSAVIEASANQQPPEGTRTENHVSVVQELDQNLSIVHIAQGHYDTKDDVEGRSSPR